MMVMNNPYDTKFIVGNVFPYEVLNTVDCNYGKKHYLI